MNLKILKKCNFTTTKWSGGDTTQLYIFPEDGSYEERNFLFRLSTASVTAEISNFTKLEGVYRKIMVLSGEMTLEHRGKYSKVLKEFDQDSFMGEWDTLSYGKVIDFNLMTKEGCIGKLENIKVTPESNATLQLTSNEFKKVLIALYPFQQKMKFFLGGDERVVEEKSLVIIELNEGEEGGILTISNESKDRTLNVVISEVIYG